MPVTVAALFAIAYALPGFVAVATFYGTVTTAGFKVAPPPLNRAVSFAFIGLLAILAHVILALLLAFNEVLPVWIPLYPPDPYTIFFEPNVKGVGYLGALSGLLVSCIIGALLGWVATKIPVRRKDELLYGWLAPLIAKSADDNVFVNAHVLSNITQNGRTLGYEGTVDELVLNSDNAIQGLVLINVSTFLLVANSRGIKRVSGKQELGSLNLRSGDFQHVALEVLGFE